MKDTHSDPANEGDGDRGSDGDQERKGLISAIQAETGKRHVLEQQVATLEGRLEELSKQTTDKPAAKTYTAAELAGLVDEGLLTQPQSNEIHDKQLRADVQGDTRKVIEETLATQNDAATVNMATNRYIEAIPTVNDTSSPERNKAEKHFARLTGSGYNMDVKDPRTTLLAMEAAFGPIEAVEAAKQRDRQPGHNETGGGDSNDADGGGGDGWSKDMPSDNRRYYQDLINKGVYTEATAAKEWNGRVKRSAA